MSRPELVILAAGMGSRYGGLKQIDPIDDGGHIIIDYSIYDAIAAGFRDITFIIKKEIEEDFRAIMDRHLAGKNVNVKYVFQELYKLPEGYSVPDGRKKPWGTAHAILCCMGTVTAPFAVINADDYYGKDAFVKIYDFLKEVTDNDEKHHYAMVGYKLGNTVTEQGSVARGVCSVSDGYLVDIVENTGIFTDGKRIYSTVDGKEIEYAPDTPVSMNLWGFTESYIEECKRRFPEFLDNGIAKNPEKCEFLLPTVVGDMMKDGRCDVKVMESTDKWYGVTYKEDKATVVAAFKKMIADGKYPANF
jgi:choline kinase